MGQIDLGKVVGDTGPGVASGGGIGDLLAKASSADYDTVWATMTQIGAELIKPGNPVGAALSNKAETSVISASYFEIHVAKTGSDTDGNGSESAPYLTIQHALNSLPHGVLTRINIYIHEGDYDESAIVNGLLCSENLCIIGCDGETVRVRAISAYIADVNIAVRNIEFLSGTSDKPSLHVESCRGATVQNCKFSGNTYYVGTVVFAYTGVCAMEITAISNCNIAVTAIASTVYLTSTVSGEGNQVAIQCGSDYGSKGGIVLKGGAAIAGAEHTAWGGQIF